MPLPFSFPRTQVTRPTRALRALPSGLVLGLLVSCAQQGDFGRPKAGVWNSLIDATGTVSAAERGGPSSYSPFSAHT